MSESTSPHGAFPWQHIPSPGKLFGAATVGERGQIAIPAEARKALDIASGDKLVVFGNTVSGALILISADVFENFAEFFAAKLNKLGEHADAFFAQFTEAVAAEESDLDDDAGQTADSKAEDTDRPPAKKAAPRAPRAKGAAAKSAPAKGGAAKTSKTNATKE
jgi:AbrB family looped-hinge helix DNA binding protein